MGQNCQVCSNPKRLEIDRGLVSGASLSSLAKLYDVTENSLSLHRDKHLSRQLITAVSKRDLMHSNGLLDIMENLFQTTDLVVSEAWRQGKLGVCLSGIGKAAGIVKLIADVIYGVRELELRKKEVETPRTITVTLVDDDGNDFEPSNASNNRINVAPLNRRQIKPEPARQPDNEKPVIDVEPVKRFVRRSKAEPEQAIKDNPEAEPDRKGKTDEFEAMRKKHEKPVKIPDETPTFTDAELDEVDGEGLTMRERLRIRPLHERAY